MEPLEISTSPRATWVWAANDAQAEVLRKLLNSAGRDVETARGGNAEKRTLDLDIGVVALDNLQVLLDAGYSFRWHSGQHPFDRVERLYGVPVATT